MELCYPLILEDLEKKVTICKAFNTEVMCIVANYIENKHCFEEQNKML